MNNELLAMLLQHPLYGQGSPVSPEQYQSGQLTKGIQAALSNKGLFGLPAGSPVPGAPPAGPSPNQRQPV